MYISSDHDIHAIHHKIVKCEKYWFKTIAKNNGSSGSGDTCELRLFGIERNNRKGPDFRATEIKTMLVTGRSRKSQKLRPSTKSGGYESTIAEDYGYEKEGIYRFYQSFAAVYHPRQKKNKEPEPSTTYKKFFANRDKKAPVLAFLVRDDQSVRLTFNGELQGEWACAEVETDFRNKSLNMCVIDSFKKVRRGVNFYNYPTYVYYEGLNIEKFWELFDAGLVTIDFRQGSKPYGTCFRMKASLLPDMYDRVITRSDYENWLDQQTNNIVHQVL